MRCDDLTHAGLNPLDLLVASFEPSFTKEGDVFLEIRLVYLLVMAIFAQRNFDSVFRYRKALIYNSLELLLANDICGLSA